MHSTLEYDWRKHASQQVPDDHQVERAFMDQAYQFLVNKGSALMKDPYRLGFEIVHKNDENTRMVGIFAFRVGTSLMYVPVFFLNGEIKGTDLLYRHDSKTFVPYEDRWIKFIISKYTRDMGRSTGSGADSGTPKDINLEDIAYPPGSYNSGTNMGKAASEGSHAVKYAREILDTIKDNSGSLLKQFILEDGGFDAIHKIASLMDSSWEFAQAMADNIPQEAWMPEEMAERMHMAKQAEEASKPRPSLILSVGGIDQLRGIPSKDMPKAAAQMAKRGYNLWDDRDSGPAKTTKPVYRDASSELTEISEQPGVWDVVMADGSTREAFVAPESRYRIKDVVDNQDWPSDQLSSDDCEDHEPVNKILVFKDGTVLCTRCAYGEPRKMQREAVEDLKQTMSQGSTYRIFDAEAGTLSEPVHVLGVTRKGGVDMYKVHKRYGEAITLRRNPDVQETQLATGFLGRDVYFVKVQTQKRKEEQDGYYTLREKQPDMGVGSDSALREWCMDNGIKQASISCNGADYSIRHGFRDQTPWSNRTTVAVKLAKEYRFHADAVEELLDDAERDGSVKFLYEAADLDKAAAIRLVDQPRFEQEWNSDFGVAEEHPQWDVLETHTDQDPSVRQNIGDAFDPGMGMGVQEDGNGLPLDQILSASPEQLAQLAQGQESPQIFEHGIIGTLTQTYDSVSMIERYLPDMEKSLDKLGRLLFLFYWKPRDFEDAYGTDDMANLENQILSNFRSHGELVLELLKRSDTRRKGTVSLAGE